MAIRVMLIGGGLVILVGCGRAVHQTVAAAPLPVVDSCLTEALHSRGDSAVVYRSEKLVRILLPGGAWIRSETRPSELGVVHRPTVSNPDRYVPIDKGSDPIRALGQTTGFWLTRDGTGTTIIETRSPQLWVYQEIAEQCATATGSTQSGI
jgi:hypothetical protein